MWNQVGSTLIMSLNCKNYSLQVIEEQYILCSLGKKESLGVGGGG